MAPSGFTFTYVIGYRHQQDRIINLRKTLDWLSGFSGIEVILVEQDRWSKISHLNLKAKHIFLKSDLPYNRSWAFNVGIKNSNTPIIAFGDGDLIMDPQQFIESVKQLEIYDVVSPYSSVVDLDQNESGYDLTNMLNINRPGRGENDNQKINLCGGIVIFKRTSINEVGGWNQDFFSWGGEDDFQTMKVNKLGLKSISMPYRCYHLWHTKAVPDTQFYERNLKILNHFATADEAAFRNQINASVGKIGMINTYS